MTHLSSAPAATGPLAWGRRLQALGAPLVRPVMPEPMAPAQWVHRNTALAEALGWQALLHDDWCQALAGNALLPGSTPAATVYSGHQFGVWAGQLGDGRALLLGEAASDAGLQELQLKGAGRTPYSRMGDGRAVLRSSVREYLASEAMHGLRIPTTRALSLTASPEPVWRETQESAAVVSRVAESFLRFGHFEHFAANGDLATLQALADHAIAHHLPQARERAEGLSGNVYAGLLQEVQARTMQLMAAWQAVGFCHGVMNTDNMSLLGLTLDYGPFQFMDVYDPGHICNHSDATGRYAFERQPGVAQWNLHRLAAALLPLLPNHELALQVLDGVPQDFAQAWLKAHRDKLGLQASDPEADARADHALLQDLLNLLAEQRIDWTIFWRRLSRAMAHSTPAWDLEHADWVALRALWADETALRAWLQRYQARCQGLVPQAMGQAMLQVNPAYVLRNHLAEQAIAQAQAGDPSEVAVLMRLLQSPFDEHPGFESRAGFAPEWARHLQISCSS